MIIVVVSVPIMGGQYDFQIDENKILYELQEEMVDMICARTQVKLRGDGQSLLLWDLEGQRLLKRDRTAAENGLATGSHLLLA